MGQLGPKMGQNEVLGHFLVLYALVFAGFAYCGRLVADGGQRAVKNLLALK